MDKVIKWKEFSELLKKVKAEPKNSTLTYLHGILFGLDYPKDGYEISSSELDQTTYYTIIYNTQKRKDLPLKDLLTKSPEGIDFVKFQTSDPEKAEEYLREHCNLKTTE